MTERLKSMLPLVLAVAAVAFPVAAAQSGIPNQAQTAASIYGRVVAGDTGQPVRSAVVTLSPLKGPPASTTTDGDGRFEFGDVPAGRYVLRVAKSGLVATFFGPTGASPEYFDVRERQRVDLGNLPLPRAGVIAGRVVDADGDPAAEIAVTAWRADYFTPGEKRLASVRSTQTNDLGEYRLFNLAPGKYYVSAGKVLSVTGPTAEGGRPAANYAAATGQAPTFYPGTASALDAQPVTVRMNQEAAGTHIRLQPVTFTRISGVVHDSSGRPAVNVYVMFNPSRADGALAFFGAGGAQTDAGGRFVIADVPPGEYRLDVLSKAKVEAIEALASSGGVGDLWVVTGESASIPVTVSGERAIELAVNMSAGKRISGRVLLDDVPVDASIVSKVRVVAFPIIPAASPITSQLQTAGAEVRPDGTFTIAGVHGPRLIRVSGMPATTVTLQRVVALGADVTDRGLDIGDTDIAGVEIRMTTRLTLVSGTVTDASGAPVSKAAVIVYSDDRTHWMLPQNRWIRGVPFNGGHFGISALPAGRYLAVAVTELERGRWADPDNLEELRRVATPFELTDGGKVTLSLVRK